MCIRDRLYDLGLAGNHAEQLDFWREEYRLNVRIKRFEKPYISLIDGIVTVSYTHLDVYKRQSPMCRR